MAQSPLPPRACPAYTEPAKVPGMPVQTEPGRPHPGCRLGSGRQRGVTWALAQLSGRLDPLPPHPVLGLRALGTDLLSSLYFPSCL